jgi:hypothetical protein
MPRLNKSKTKMKAPESRAKNSSTFGQEAEADHRGNKDLDEAFG